MLEALEDDPSHTDREVTIQLVPLAGHDFDGRHATIRLYTPQAELVQETRVEVRGDRVRVLAAPGDYLIEAHVEGFLSRRLAFSEDVLFAGGTSLWLEE